MTAFQKGSITKTGHEYIRDTYGEEVWQQVLERLTDEEREIEASVDRSTQYPMSVEASIFEALGDLVCEGDMGAIREEFHKGGRCQADTMLDGVFSIFARFATPQQAFDRAGNILATAYENVESETIPSSNGPGGTIVLRGLGDVTYLAPWITGWMERAIERFGGINPQVTEENWEAGRSRANELVFNVSWF